MATTKKYGSDGVRLSDCCGCYATYCDATLCCMKCWREVSIGEGDGCERRQDGANRKVG